MILTYKMTNGDVIKSPSLTDEEIQQAIDYFGDFTKTRGKAGGYIWDKHTMIDLEFVMAISIDKEEEWRSDDA